MNESILGVVVDMDVSHMIAEVKLDNEDFVNVKVGRIYNVGDEIKIYDTENISKPWYLQGTEWIDENPISEAEVMRGGVKLG